MRPIIPILLLALLASSSFAEDTKTKITAAGETIATTPTQPLAFHGAAPVVLRAGTAQTAITDSSGGSTADHTLAAVTAPSAITDSTGGSASTTLAAITAGSSYAQADATATKNALASLAARQAEDKAAIIALTNAVAKEAVLLNELRAALVQKGLIKGSN